MTASKLQKFSILDYVDLEQSTQTKYEYHNGEVFALAGGSINHALLCGNIFGELRNQLKLNAKNCVAISSEMKLAIQQSNSYVYPDAMVVCDKMKRDDQYKESINNPTLIVEVLSKTTADYDRGDKFYKYRSLHSFQEYLLIEQDKPVVDIYYRKPDTSNWQIDRYEGLETSFALQSLGIKIDLRVLYEDVEFEKKSQT